MPEMDGYEATTRLRQSPSVEIRSIPIVAMTASAIRGDREKCLAAGMSDYLSKPVKSKALESMLVKWLFDQATRQSLSKYFALPDITRSIESQTLTPTGAPSVTASSEVTNGILPGSSSTSSAEARPSRLSGSSGAGMEDVYGSEQASQQPAIPAIPEAPTLESHDSSETVRGTIAVEAARNKNSLSPVLENSSDGHLRASSAELPSVDTVARRSSAQNESQPRTRPAHPPRSRSAGTNYQWHTSNSVVAAASGIGFGLGNGKGTDQLDVRAPDLIRRSSREQAGLGRDLEGELVKATTAGSDRPSLGPSLDSDGDLSMRANAVPDLAGADVGANVDAGAGAGAGALPEEDAGHARTRRKS